MAYNGSAFSRNGALENSAVRGMEQLASADNVFGSRSLGISLRPTEPRRGDWLDDGRAVVGSEDCDEEVRLLAYRLWEAAGRPSGREHEFWAEASRQVEAPNGEQTPPARHIAR
ncbi:DUF2934 domain-containing protein [Aureimonas sp. AU4]|uniref:DUF2934 domain-containing protein n=1 Tax=Aureimonas sp. AU4 TaxID=1638163 RepID=UPI00278C8BC2|nr:DUF2934 domain-containing protein [Aureimonas sp. AU4]